MANVWRFTGNPENWLTAIERKAWALNEDKKSAWEKILPGDTVVFHSTMTSDYKAKLTSSIIGFGYIGEGKYIKDDFWWVQEMKEQKNKWPYVIPFKEIHLYSEIEGIDFSKSIDQKSDEQVIKEIAFLLKGSIPIKRLSALALEADPNSKAFPVMGSVSSISSIYESLLLENPAEPQAPFADQDNEIYEEKLAEDIDKKLSKVSLEVIRAQALSYDDSGKASHAIVSGPRKVRRESAVQKRRIAKMEDYTCQVCGFKCAYTRMNGETGWIIEVDHINDKAGGAGESINNLWALCPNCHKKKTRGVITIDVVLKKVFEGGIEIKINDHHLGFYETLEIKKKLPA